MKFCQDHWERLRQKIDERGLAALISENGEQAARNLVREFDEGPSIDSFDPLMGAHNAILSNAIGLAQNLGANPMVMFAEQPENPEWECPVCFLNWLAGEHDRLCPDAACEGKGVRFDWMLDRAADEMAAVWQRLGGSRG